MKKSKKILSLLLSVAMFCTIFTTFGLTVSAAGTQWVSGSGTQASPYLITNAAELEYLAEKVNAGEEYAGVYFKVVKDIDLSGVPNWIPIAADDNSNVFRGDFDGGNHIISGMSSEFVQTENRDCLAGLFGYIENATISNIIIKNATISANNQSSTTACAAGIVAAGFDSTITNCMVIDSTISSQEQRSPNDCASGIAGYVSGINFENCAVINTSITATCTAGGLVATISDDSSALETQINKCFTKDCTLNIGTFEGVSPNNCGALIGQVIVNKVFTQDCFTLNCSINNSSTSYCHGGLFVGDLWNAGATHGSKLTATNCYVSGNIGSNINEKNIFANHPEDTTFKNCFYNGDLTEVVVSQEGITEKTTSEMTGDEFASLLGGSFKYDRGFVTIVGIDISIIPDVRKTTISATTVIPNPTYTVTIPSTIDFANQTQALEKYRDKVSDKIGEINVKKAFNVQATGVDNMFDGKKLFVTVNEAVNLTLEGGTKTIPCKVYQGESEYTTGTTFATFINDVQLTADQTNTQAGAVSINRCDLTEAGNYKGTMNFTIEIKEAN